MVSSKKYLLSKLTGNALVMTFLEMIVRYGVAVIVLPVALKKLESTELAYYLFINTLIALAFLADSGFSQAMIRAAAYFRGGAIEIPARITEIHHVGTESKPNWQGVGRLVATTGHIYLVIGAVAMLLLLTLGGATAYNIIRQQSHQIATLISFALLILLSFILLQVSRWSSILQGLNEIARAKRIELVTGLLRIIGMAFALHAGFGVLGVVAAMTLSAMMNLLLMRMSVLQLLKYNGVLKKHKVHDPSMLKRLWPATWRMALICWGSYLIYYGSSVIISQIHDAKLVASYLLTFQVVTLVYRFSTSPLIVYQPQVAAAMSSGDLNKVKHLTLKIVRYSLVMYLVGALLVYFFAGDALILIKSKSHLLSGDILLIMLLMYFLEMHHVLHAGIYMATNHVPFMVQSLISGIVIVVGGFLTLKNLGIYGVVLTQLIVQASFNNWYPVYLSLKIQKMTFSAYVRNIFQIGYA